MPFGINKISVSDIKDYEYCYEFSKTGLFNKKWEKVTVINRAKKPTEFTDDEPLLGETPKIKDLLNQVCLYEIITDKDGRIATQIKAYTSKKKLIYCFNIISHIENDTLKYAIGNYIDAHGLPIQSILNGANTVKITYNTNGFRNLIEYFDAYGNRTANYNFAVVQKYIYYNHPDSIGLLKESWSCDQNGNYVYDKHGSSGIIISWKKHNDKWVITENRSVNPNRETCNENCGYAITRYEYDNIGRNTKVSYFYDNNNPCVIEETNKTAYHSKVTKYHDNYITYEYYNEKGKLSPTWIAIQERTFDPNTGNIISIEDYNNKKEHYNPNATGYGIKLEYSDPDNYSSPTEVKLLGVDRSIYKIYPPITKYTYDKNGNTISEQYFDYNGETQILNYLNIAGIYTYYDSTGNIIEKKIYRYRRIGI